MRLGILIVAVCTVSTAGFCQSVPAEAGPEMFQHSSEDHSGRLGTIGNRELIARLTARVETNDRIIAYWRDRLAVLVARAPGAPLPPRGPLPSPAAPSAYGESQGLTALWAQHRQIAACRIRLLAQGDLIRRLRWRVEEQEERR